MLVDFMLVDFVIFLVVFIFLTAFYFASKKAKKEINTIIDNQNKENAEATKKVTSQVTRVTDEIKIPFAAIDLIKKFEGFQKNVYLDLAGIPTIGYGTTEFPIEIIQNFENFRGEDYFDSKTPTAPKDNYKYLSSVTEKEAEKLLMNHLIKIKPQIQKLVNVPLSSNEISALLSLVYNIGVGAFAQSTLLKKINAKAGLPEIEKEFLKWKHVNKKIVAGLLNRRIAEFKLYCTSNIMSIVK
jgi:lysozyme